MKESLIVASGGAIGAVLRYITNAGFDQLHLPFNWATATAFENIAGSFLIGFIFTRLISKNGLKEKLNLFLITGILGSYTSYSAFSAEAFLLLNTSFYSMLGYVLLQIGSGLVAVSLGYYIVLNFFTRNPKSN
jgi:CrcB protein